MIRITTENDIINHFKKHKTGKIKIITYDNFPGLIVIDHETFFFQYKKRENFKIAFNNLKRILPPGVVAVTNKLK